MARSDAFFAKLGRRPDISTISDRFFDENSIDFFDRLLDDRRLLDDTFIVLARMRDVEKTLKNLDRAHKIRVRRCSASPCSKTVWTANYFENASKNRTQDPTKNKCKIERTSGLWTLENGASGGAGRLWEALGKPLGEPWGAPGEASGRAWGAPGEPPGRT